MAELTCGLFLQGLGRQRGCRSVLSVHAAPVGWVTDGPRLVATLSMVVAGLLYGWTRALILVVVSAVVWVPRIAALPRPVDLAIGTTW